MADVMHRKQFTFYESFAKALSRIKDKSDRADAYDAICNYALYGIEPDFDCVSDSVAIAFDLIKPNLDASKRKAMGGMKGSKAKDSDKTEERPCEDTEKMPTRPYEDTNNKKEKEGENEKEEEYEKEYECIYTPPAPPPPVPPKPDPPNQEPERHKYGQYGWVLLSDAEYGRLVKEYGTEKVKQAISYVDEAAQTTGNKNKWKDWNLTVRRCIRDGWGQNANNKGANTNGSTGVNSEPRKRYGTYL